MFYAPDILTSLELPEEESLHAMRVLRLHEGSEIILTDGKGSIYKAVISRTSGKRCEVNILERQTPSPLRSARIHIALAPTKNMERTEWFCEKATEIGIDAISFLICRRSERRELKTSRIEKIIISAMKQSQKATLPELTPPEDFAIFASRTFASQKYIAHCAEGEKTLLKEACTPGTDTLVLIGPEGDFSPEEIDLAVAHGFHPVSLGDCRLRTETAALVACHTVALLN
jgi:16S rRNA (uracil1498-N3)-methyltransferase